MSVDSPTKRIDTFADLVAAAAGSVGGSVPLQPYDYQRRIADEGLPDVINVPTGAGKTLGSTLPWVWRRIFHPDQSVRDATPRRLILVLPTRALTAQTEESVRGWLENLGLADRVGVHVMMGGRRDARAHDWRMDLAQEMVIICTADMLVSRALNRGYGVPRTSYPLDFALVTNGAHVVVDEVQLIPQATATLRQIRAMQLEFGTAEPSGLTVMSATIDKRVLDTVDHPYDATTTVVGLSDADRASHLATRLRATRTIHRLSEVTASKAFASAILSRHRDDSLTLVIVNTVERAIETYEALKKAAGDVPLLLIHSRFRSIERHRQLERLKTLAGQGGIVVTTQAIEAGVDISSRTLISEAAPWPSMQQRIGRNNRAGEFAAGEAAAWWCEAAKTAPYEADEVAASAEALTALEGEAVTTTRLAEIAEASIPEPDLLLRILRRRDFEQMFDTTPDLSGSDIDVRPFIRPDLNVDCQVAWIPDGAGESLTVRATPSAEALRCGVPITTLTKFVSQPHVRAWVFAPNRDGWVAATSKRLKPQDIVLVERSSGGYDPERGFVESSKKPVDITDLDTPQTPECASERLDAGSADNGLDPRWISLQEHLVDTQDQARALLEAMDPQAISAQIRRVVTAAALTHDLGKAHEDWQEALLTTSPESERPTGDGPWAKSPGRGRLVVLRGGAVEQNRGGAQHIGGIPAAEVPASAAPNEDPQAAATAPTPPKLPERAGFRHELVSLFVLSGQAAMAEAKRLDVSGDTQLRLLRYLVASHHGHVRVSGRDWRSGRDATGLFGCEDGEITPRVTVAGFEFPPSTIDLGVFSAGSHNSWTDGVMRLLDELGPFRLAYLEAVVRMADWRASAHLPLPTRSALPLEES